MRTDQPNLPPPKFVFDENSGRRGEAHDSIVAAGTIIAGGHVTRSIIGPKSRVEERSEVTESILFSGVHIGKGAIIRRAIIDKNVFIPDGAQVGVDHDADRRRGFEVTEKHCCDSDDRRFGGAVFALIAAARTRSLDEKVSRILGYRRSDERRCGWHRVEDFGLGLVCSKSRRGKSCAKATAERVARWLAGLDDTAPHESRQYQYLLDRPPRRGDHPGVSRC